MAGRDKPQKSRNYSWLITSDATTPYHKGQIADLRAICLSPPDPPWALAIATSGQKVIVYRTPVNVDNSGWLSVQLEDRAIHYTAVALSQAIETASRIVRLSGKPALLQPCSHSLYDRLCDEYGDKDTDWIVDRWFNRQSDPVLVLAAYLSPSKGDLT